MHVLFVHKPFYGQFEPIARALAKREGFQVTFACEQLPRPTPAAGAPAAGQPSRMIDGIQMVEYKAAGGPTRSTHNCCQAFEDSIWQSHALYEVLKGQR